MLLKALFNSTIRQGKDGLFNKTGAATIGYSVGKKLGPPPHTTFIKIFQMNQRSKGNNK